MRSFVFAMIGGLAIPGCLVGDGDVPSGGTVQPAVTATIDKAEISTELGKVETLTVTVTGTNGFSGAVDINASVVDAAGVPVEGWTLIATPSSVDLTTDGSVQVSLEVSVPIDAAVMSPHIRVDLITASGTVPVEASAAVTVEQQITIDLAATGTAVPHKEWPPVGQTITIPAGTKVVFHNADTIAHRIHGAGGILHEGSPLAPGADYTVTPSANGQWWCHEHGEGSGAARSIKVLPAAQ